MRFLSTPKSGAVLATLLIALFLLYACTSHRANAPVTPQPQRVQLHKLKRDQYQILGAVSAQSCTRLVILFPLPIWFTLTERNPEDPNSETDINLWGTHPEQKARDYAEYQAIGKQWKADALIAPREHIEEYSVLPFYQRSCVTVRGQAFRYIPDEELYASPPEEKTDLAPESQPVDPQTQPDNDSASP